MHRKLWYVFGGVNLRNNKVGQIFFSWKRRSWALVDACNFLFCESWFRACTGSFGDLPKSTNFKNIKVGQILLLSKSGSWVPVDACNFFGVGSLIRACTGGKKPYFYHFWGKERSNWKKFKKRLLQASTRDHDPFWNNTKIWPTLIFPRCAPGNTFPMLPVCALIYDPLKNSYMCQLWPMTFFLTTQNLT